MILLVIFGVGVVAGFVDAIAGGGGLIMLPGLLFSGLPVSSAIATNKLCGTCGAIASTTKFAIAKQIDWRACQLMALPVIVGAYLGSRSIGLLPTAWAEPTVVILISLITLFVIFNPALGKTPRQSKQSQNKKREKIASLRSLKTIVSLALAGSIIGFHDGFFGPGTGIFLVFSLIFLLQIDFLRATGTTKLLNLLTNITALITFALGGTINYPKGLSGAIGVSLGSYIGATFATKKGVKLIKPVFIFVTIALVIKLIID